jgi:hypothetical protein
VWCTPVVRRRRRFDPSAPIVNNPSSEAPRRAASISWRSPSASSRDSHHLAARFTAAGGRDFARQLLDPGDRDPWRFAARRAVLLHGHVRRQRRAVRRAGVAGRRVRPGAHAAVTFRDGDPQPHHVQGHDDGERWQQSAPAPRGGGNKDSSEGNPSRSRRRRRRATSSGVRCQAVRTTSPWSFTRKPATCGSRRVPGRLRR